MHATKPFRWTTTTHTVMHPHNAYVPYIPTVARTHVRVHQGVGW
jgi:hypothetical protein